ncbi:MAG: ABC transporter substrate-binding protein [Clostridia bacterium]|nr:ABC transporter substrate-binding protein [Clostridia bacterium]
MRKSGIKTLVSLLMALTLILGSCLSASAEEKTFTVGILQLIQHPALDQATQGFKDALTEKLGDKVVFEEGNASGDSNNCAQIASQLVSHQVDLIMANATPAMLACATATADIPVLATSITNYESAMEIELTPEGATGINVSGTSDLAPLDGQAAMIQELFPNAKTVGLIYCSAEPNSIFQIKTIEGYLKDMGYECRRYGFNDSNDLASVVQSSTECDVLYIPTDNTAAGNTEAIANIVLPAGVPVVVGEEGICSGCGVATLTISYYDIGYKTGEMAYDILVNGADIASMPIAYAPQFTKKYNAANAAALNITIPEGYLPIE